MPQARLRLARRPELTEDQGCTPGADAETVSKTALERGMHHLGTLGSGNHYLEIQVVRPENIYNEKLAEAFGLFPNQVVVMFHCGSRGFGHQIATDFLKVFLDVMERKYDIRVRDQELAAAPFQSPEGQAYFKAMKCAINMSFANRQVILHRIREVFSDIFGQDARDLGLQMVYDARTTPPASKSISLAAVAGNSWSIAKARRGRLPLERKTFRPLIENSDKPSSSEAAWKRARIS